MQDVCSTLAGMVEARSEVNGSNIFDVYQQELLKLFRHNMQIENELKAKAAAAAEEAAK
jgi:hypothetical protein